MSDQNAPLIVTYNPDASGQRPYLKEAGKYGPGMEHDAIVTINRVQLVDKAGLPDSLQWMKDDPCDFIDVGFEVVSSEFGKSFLNNRYRVGRELNEFLATMGADSIQSMSENPDGTKSATVDLTQLEGMKVACVEVKAPRLVEGVWRNGYVVKVYGA